MYQILILFPCIRSCSLHLCFGFNASGVIYIPLILLCMDSILMQLVQFQCISAYFYPLGSALFKLVQFTCIESHSHASSLVPIPLLWFLYTDFYFNVIVPLQSIASILMHCIHFQAICSIPVHWAPFLILGFHFHKWILFLYLWSCSYGWGSYCWSSFHSCTLDHVPFP